MESDWHPLLLSSALRQVLSQLVGGVCRCQNNDQNVSQGKLRDKASRRAVTIISSCCYGSWCFFASSCLILILLRRRLLLLLLLLRLLACLPSQLLFLSEKKVLLCCSCSNSCSYSWLCHCFLCCCSCHCCLHPFSLPAYVTFHRPWRLLEVCCREKSQTTLVPQSL